MDGVSDDDNILNIWSDNSLIDPTPDGEQLSLSSSDIYGLINILDNGLIIQVNMEYWGSNAVSDAHIWNNNR